MADAFKVGSPVSHPKHGNGAVIQILNNQPHHWNYLVKFKSGFQEQFKANELCYGHNWKQKARVEALREVMPEPVRKPTPEPMLPPRPPRTRTIPAKLNGMVAFTADNLPDVARFLRSQAAKADRASITSVRNRMGQYYYFGQRDAWIALAEMIEAGQLVIRELQGAKGG